MSAATAYFKSVSSKKDQVIAVLEKKRVSAEHLRFGGPGAEPKRKPYIPSSERGDFFVHRPMGDWAEESIAASMRETFPEWGVLRYGEAGVTRFDDPNFKERYLAGLLETRLRGKKPDLLILPKSVEAKLDVSKVSADDLKKLVANALAAVEVRSSQCDALKYIAVRQQQIKSGKDVGRESPSFTVKVEDLIIVYRWIENFGVPQSYCQVFFDSVFAINFLNIFSVIASGKGFTIDVHERSQGKSTIMIPVTSGEEIGRANEPVKITAKYQVTPLGRYQTFLLPEGGRFQLDQSAVRRVFLAEGASSK